MLATNYRSKFIKQLELAASTRGEQRKVIKYNPLVANCICFYNVASISNVLDNLSEEGISVNIDALKAINPYTS